MRPCQLAGACAQPYPPHGTRPASCPGHAGWHHPLKRSQDGASGCPQGHCRPQTVSRKGWTCWGSFSLHGQKRRRWRGVGSRVGGEGVWGRQRGAASPGWRGLGIHPGQRQGRSAMETVQTDPRASSGWGGGGLGPFSKRLLRSTNARTSLMAAREEPQLPASSVVQPGGRWGWWRWHHRGRGDPQCPGWASGEEAVRDKPLVTDSVHPPQEPRQRAQGRQPVLQGQSTEETPRSSYKRARVSIRQKPRLRTQEAELIHGCSAHRAAVCPGEACPRPDPPSEAP